MSFKLDQVVPWGRSYNEYLAMFDLQKKDLKKRILGCSDGPASFNHDLNQQGGKVLSVDPLYEFSEEEIKRRINETFHVVLEETRKNQSEFVWENIESVEELGEVRQSAMDQFLSDFKKGKEEGRYLKGELPHLSFSDQDFDLALCSHFLFLYSEQFDLEFHKKSIQELLRVASEVRIFPILELGSGLSRHFVKVLTHLDSIGVEWSIHSVPYEFQKGGDKMLKILKK